MSVTPSVLTLVQQTIPGLVGPVAEMPVAENFPLDPAGIKGFGISGGIRARRFQTSLEITASSTGLIPVNSILEGQVSWVGANIAIEPPRDDGTVFLTRRPGLLLKVHPRQAIKRLTTETVDDPLEYPFAFWVLYEGVEPDATLRDAMALEFFATADFFAFDSSALPSNASQLLDELSVNLQANPNLTVLLTGYTDAEGSPTHNIELGMARALAIRDYLVDNGIDGQRIETRALGETDLKLRNAPNRDAAGINRRVEIELRLDEPVYVKPGDFLGQASQSVSISVLDPLGYFLDPLALILLLRPDLKNHPLASHVDPFSPRVTSHRVHVVSADPGQDGAADNYPHFTFHDSLQDALVVCGDNDTVLVDLPSFDVNISLTRPVSLIGALQADNTLPAAHPLDDREPILQAHFFPDARPYGVRIIGLSFSNGRSSSGGALDLRGQRNAYIAHCGFSANFAGASWDDPDGNGGAIRLVNSQKVLVQSCNFQLNVAKRGGAIYAEDCQALVVTGITPLELEALRVSETNLSVPHDPSLPAVIAGIPPVLTGEGFTSLFVNNSSRESGGAIFAVNSSFRINSTFFAKNSSQPFTSESPAYGGAIGIQDQFESANDVESLISQCVAILNTSNYGGAFATAGTFDGEAAINGNPNSFAGGCRLRISKSVIHQNSAEQIGGGLHLVTGAYHLHDNRISNNDAHRNGGGLSLMSSGEANIDRNRILFNLVSGDLANLPFTQQVPTPNGVGGGGGGLYLSFWTSPNQPRARLSQNNIIGNLSRETGGGLRASCGAEVILAGGNLFQDNIAFLHGGAVALNAASLTIEPGNQFIRNQTQDGRTASESQRFRGGHGGAIYCYGGRVAASDWDNTRFATCASDGTNINILGSPTDPVLFQGNHATRQGGAIYIEREDAITNTVFRKVFGNIQHALLDDNRAAESIVTGSGTFTGSALAAFHMNEPAAFPIPLITLRDSEIRLFQGVGLYLVDSSALLHHNNIAYVQVSGASGILDELIE